MLQGPTNIAMLFCGLALVGISAYFSWTADFKLAYGRLGSAWGQLQLGVAFLTLAAGAIGRWAVRRHNKCGLTCMMASHCCSLCVLGLVCTSLIAATNWGTDIDRLRPCLQPLQPSTFSEHCKGYLSDRHTNRLLRLWKTMHDEAGAGNSVRKQQLAGIEEQKGCCGFSPPRTCGVLHSAGSNRTVQLLRSDAPVEDSLTMCGPPRWYQESSFCSVLQLTSNERGCPSFLSVVSVCEDPNTSRPGCGVHLALYLRESLTPLMVALCLVWSCQCWACVATSCYCWHRKYYDAQPPPVFSVNPRFMVYDSAQYPISEWQHEAAKHVRAERIVQADRALQHRRLVQQQRRAGSDWLILVGEQDRITHNPK
jgi:hypothetical protein